MLTWFGDPDNMHSGGIFDSVIVFLGTLCRLRIDGNHSLLFIEEVCKKSRKTKYSVK